MIAACGTSIHAEVPQAQLSADVKLAPAGRTAMAQTTHKVVAIVASTGGTEALRVVLQRLRQDGPLIVVVQHMADAFTRGFGKRLDEMCQITVKEAGSGDGMLPGRRHLMLIRSGANFRIEIKDGPLVGRHPPGCPTR